MKKVFAVSLIIILITGIIANAVDEVFITNFVKYKLEINGVEINTDLPMIDVDGRTYIELRSLCDIMGSEIDWNEYEQSIEITTDTVYTETEDIYFQYIKLDDNHNVDGYYREKADLVLSDNTLKKIGKAILCQVHKTLVNQDCEMAVEQTDDSSYCMLTCELTDGRQAEVVVRKSDGRFKQMLIKGGSNSIITNDYLFEISEETARTIGMAVLEQMCDEGYLYEDFYKDHPFEKVYYGEPYTHYTVYRDRGGSGIATYVDVRRTDGKISVIRFWQ